MILQFAAVPNSSVIAEEIGRYPNLAIDADVLLNQSRFHFKLLGPSRRHEAVLDLCQDLVEDLGSTNNEHRMAQLKREVRETVSRMQ
jgi:hypothetical protein